MRKLDVDTFLGCSARAWLDDHTEPLSPFVNTSPGPYCALACPSLERCPTGMQYVALTECDSIRRDRGVASVAPFIPQRS